MFWMWIIVTLLVFTFIVVVHEWWHFRAARFFGVKVEEFWIGIPPRMRRLFSDKKWTLYSLNWIPFGWFVRLKGESEANFQVYSKKWKKLSEDQLKLYLRNDTPLFSLDSEELSADDRKRLHDIIRQNNQEDNLYKKPYWQQSIIILAWVFMNFFLAWVIFSLLFIFWVQPIGINTVLKTNVESLLIPTYEQSLSRWILEKWEWTLVYPIAKSRAATWWLLDWDIVLKINGVSITSLDQFKNTLQLSAWKESVFDIRRSGEDKNFKIFVWTDGKIGSYISDNINYNKNFIYQMSFWESFYYWWKEVYSQSVLTLEWLKFIFSRIFFPVKQWDREEAIKSMSGPIGVTKIITEGLSLWFSFLCIIAALISVNLAVFNLLPIPALDWWRFLFICIHWFFSLFSKNKIVSSYFENIVHVLFFVILIMMSIGIAYNDVLKLFQ